MRMRLSIGMCPKLSWIVNGRGWDRNGELQIECISPCRGIARNLFRRGTKEP